VILLSGGFSGLIHFQIKSKFVTDCLQRVVLGSHGNLPSFTTTFQQSIGCKTPTNFRQSVESQFACGLNPGFTLKLDGPLDGRKINEKNKVSQMGQATPKNIFFKFVIAEFNGNLQSRTDCNRHRE